MATTTTREQRAATESDLYQIKITRADATGVAAYVRRDGREYGVRLSDGVTVCSCPDAMFRDVACKHGLMLKAHVRKLVNA